MAQYAYLSIAVLLSLIGLVGCFVPIVPGPLVSYCGLLVLIPAADHPSTTTLVVYGIVTIVVTALDYIVPAIGAKKFNCSKYGTRGCTIGTIVGLFFPPIGIFIGPFLGAYIGELIAKRPSEDAAMGALGAFLGFLSGVLIKLFACVAMFACLLMCF